MKELLVVIRIELRVIELLMSWAYYIRVECLNLEIRGLLATNNATAVSKYK